MTPPSANPLALALAAGRQEAYAALYDRLARALLRVAGAMLRDSAEAEDAVQDVFVELIRHRHRIAQVDDLDRYVFAMLRHGLWRRLKCRATEQKHLRELSPLAHIGPTETAADDLDRALAKLPADQREVIALKIDGGLTFAQIAVILEVSPNTVASRYRYALEKLRRDLE